MSATKENIKFAQTAFAQFNLSIQQGNDGRPIYVIGHHDSKVVAALKKKLAPVVSASDRSDHGNPAILLTTADIVKLRTTFNREHRSDYEMGLSVPPLQFQIADLMRSPQQSAVPLANPQLRQGMLHAAAGSISVTYFSPGEVKNIFQQLDANPQLKQHFLSHGGKSYEDTLALRSLPDKSLYLCQQTANLSFAIRLLYGINVAVSIAEKGGYNVNATTPAGQGKLQQIKSEAHQSQNPHSFLSAPPAASSASATQMQSPQQTQGSGIVHRSLKR